MLVMLLAPILLLWAHAASGVCADLPLADAHIHYNHDVWERLTPQEAIARLRQAGIVHALVSSSSDEGTQRLYAAAPDLVVPELRPYRANGETSSWFHDESVIPYLQQRLARYRYVAIGEFHIHGADADLPIVTRLVALAQRHGLLLHAHADADAIERLILQNPQGQVLWAHAGYEEPALVLGLLRRHPRLWVDLSSRDDLLSASGSLTPEWRAALVEFPTRFMLGTDTHTPERWTELEWRSRRARHWLDELPAHVAEHLAYKNARALFVDPFGKEP